MRQIIISAIGLLIIAVGYFGMKKMGSREKPTPKKTPKSIPVAFSESVSNSTMPITITASGNLSARDRIEIYSEVQGIFDYSEKSFKPGIYYPAGAVLIKLNSDEHRANLKSQKSSLYNQVVGLLPDLKFDYPEAYDVWFSYVESFKLEAPLKKFPEPTTTKEKLFIANRNISTNWYMVKNLEERSAKYTITAPYDGILTEANIDKGVLVRPGQKLGEFINPNIYELEVAVNSAYASLLNVGNQVTLQDVEKTNTWKGKVSRVNSLVDPNTQTIQAYIRVNGSGLREGMYLEASLQTKNEKNTYTISRKLLVDNNKIYKINKDKLELIDADIVHFTENEAVLKDLPEGIEILSRVIPGAFDGMTVQRYKEN